jgi:tetratricopeptide (TPR) repeat protein
MRHAVVVAPLHFALPAQGNVLTSPEPVGPLCLALSRGGSRVVVLPTTPDLENDFDRALGGMGEGDQLLVFVAGETSTHATTVALRLGDEATPSLPLRVLSDVVQVREPSSVLFIVEACHDGPDDDPMLAAEHVNTIAYAIDARARGYGALVGVRPAARATPGAWPFTRHLLYAMQHPQARDASGAATMSRVFERLRAESPEQGQVQSFVFIPGRGDFLLAAAPDSQGPRPNRPPPSSASGAGGSLSPSPPSSARRSSFPPPSLPAIEPLIDLAGHAFSRGAWEEALAGYKAALMVAPESDFESRATIYARMGDVKRAQGKPREAENNYEKALSVEPGQRSALDGLIDLAIEAKEPRRAIEWRRKRLVGLDSAEEIVAELGVIARTHAQDLGDTRAAAEALEEAHAIAPGNRAILDDLRAAYEKLHRWPRVVELLAEAGGLSDDPITRAALRFAAADVALGRLRDEERGLALLERALEDDPRHDQALQALVAVRSGRNDWQALDAVYTRLIDRFAKLDDAGRAWDACRKLGVLRRDKTRDVRGAIEAFTGAVSCKPSDVDSRMMLADMHLAVGDEAQALAAFERVAQAAPTRASTFARLYALHHRAGRTDRAWLAATALEELGGTDVDQQLAVDQFRSDGPIRPSRSLDDAGWEELAAPGADDVVAGVLGAVAFAARAAQVEELRDARKLIALDPARRQSATSTASVVRSFHWAAQVLGIEAPALYVMDSVPGGIAAVQAAEPSTALGPDVLRNLGTKDLAFLAGRHLTYYRREHYALLHYPTLAELSVLFLAAVKLAMPAVPVPTHLDAAVARTRKQLLRYVGDTEKVTLAAAVERLDARDGRVDLAAWIRGVELTGARAGLLLSGDLRTAMTRLRAETRSIGELDLEQKRADLLAFCAGERFARLRASMGLEAGVRTSATPPPVSQRDVG